MNTPTRPATPHDARPVELPNLRAPRLPTFFATALAYNHDDPCIILGCAKRYGHDGAHDCDEQEENGK